MNGDSVGSPAACRGVWVHGWAAERRTERWKVAFQERTTNDAQARTSFPAVSLPPHHLRSLAWQSFLQCFASCFSLESQLGLLHPARNLAHHERVSRPHT